MFKRSRHLLFCLVLLLQLSSTCGADATYLQPDSVYLGDITQLVVEYDSGIPSLYSLDTSALQADFEVIDKESRIFRLAATGDANEVVHRMQWRLHLLPRRIGSLSVPALSFSDKSTSPLTLEVAPVPPSLQASRQVFVEMKADNQAPYLGQQTQITMQLYRNTAVTDSRLFEPQTGDARVHRQLQEKSYRASRNGHSFEVLERGFALFPRNAGELHLTPVNYRGSIEASSADSQTESAIPKRNILRRSKPLSLQVRNPPAEFSGRFWLPATSIELSQRWNESGKRLRVGDSLDWTLTITARGLPAESLPVNLLSMETEKFKVYADQPTRSNRFEGRQIIGRLEQRFAIVASQAGEIELPSPDLRWWDVVSDSEKRVKLAGKTIKILDARVAANSRAELDQEILADWWMRLRSSQWSDLRILLSMLMLALVLAAIKPLSSWIAEALKPVMHRRRLARRLKRSCRSNDAAATRAALIEWGRERWPGQTINGLNFIDRQIGSREFSAQLKHLDAALYSQQQSDWNGEALWRQVITLKRSQPWARSQAAVSHLPRLYPG